MCKSLTLKIGLNALIASIVGLSAHIYLQGFFGKKQALLLKGHTIITPEQYSSLVILMAYITAFEQVVVAAIAYYFVGGLFQCNRIIKIIILTFFYMELHGELIRITIMNFLVAQQSHIKSPLLFALYSQADKLIASILIVTILVLFMPVKHGNKLRA